MQCISALRHWQCLCRRSSARGHVAVCRARMGADRRMLVLGCVHVLDSPISGSSGVVGGGGRVQLFTPYDAGLAFVTQCSAAAGGLDSSAPRGLAAYCCSWLSLYTWACRAGVKAVHCLLPARACNAARGANPMTYCAWPRTRTCGPAVCWCVMGVPCCASMPSDEADNSVVCQRSACVVCWPQQHQWQGHPQRPTVCWQLDQR